MKIMTILLFALSFCIVAKEPSRKIANVEDSVTVNAAIICAEDNVELNNMLKPVQFNGKEYVVADATGADVKIPYGDIKIIDIKVIIAEKGALFCAIIEKD